MKWKTKRFTDLTTRELFEIYQARVAVFVVEQACAYREVDEQDLISLHLVAEDDVGVIVAYARLIPAKDNVKIGRVLVNQNYRDNGIGKILLQRAIETAQCRYPDCIIRLQAQSYLLDFYTKFGFRQVSANYLEDGIEHVDMERR